MFLHKRMCVCVCWGVCLLLCGRITKKSDIRRWSNARGEGYLFSVELLDEDGSEVKGTFFKADADRWIDVLQEGQVYSFSGGRVKVCLSCWECMRPRKPMKRYPLLVEGIV